MKLAMLFLSLTFAASAAHSFDMDLSEPEMVKLRGGYLVEELTVATKGRISFARPCTVDGRLMVSEEVEIKPDGDFIITRKPTGNFSLTFSPLDYRDKPTKEIYEIMRPIYFNPCGRFYFYNLETLTPVDDIDGFTKYSDWAEHVLKTFKLNE